MQRRQFLQQAGLGGILAAGVAPAVHAQTDIRWRLVSSFPKTLDTIYIAAEVFAKKVAEATNGRFIISVHAGGELVPPLGVVDAVQQGTVECAHTSPYYFFGKDDTFAIDCAIPFGLNSRQMSAWTYEGNGLQLFREFYRNYNIVNFAMGNTGAQMGGWYRHEIKTLADIRGLKIRIGGFSGKVFSALGAVPQSIPGGETYQALEKGVIDAAEWVGPYDDEKFGFYKVAKHYYYPGWWEGGPQLALYVNAKAWEQLPADYKVILTTAASHAHVHMQARYDVVNPPALKRLVAKGTQVHRFSPQIMQAAYDASMALYSDLSAKNPAWRKIYADYAAFRDEQVLWARFAEASFDQFMQTGRNKKR
ncbi:MAG: ABC transporter substrate-binding protein [Rugosibacter sp.]|nr:MAG: ABC transporter substrate-binding protein [Rugosibacter sp.]